MIKKLLAILLALFAAVAFAAVDANKATQAELEAVKGIGPAISTKIIDERKKAPFKDWNDMVERVKGVGEGNAAKFSTEGLTVNGAAFTGAAPAAAAAKKEAKPAAAAKAEEKKSAATAAAPAAAAAPMAKAEAKADVKADAKATDKPAAMSADDKKAAAKKAKEEKAAAAKKAKEDKAAAAIKAKEDKAAAAKPAAGKASEPKPTK